MVNEIPLFSEWDPSIAYEKTMRDLLSSERQDHHFGSVSLPTGLTHPDLKPQQELAQQ